MKKLFEFDIDWGRGFGVSALFIATQKEIDGIIGKNIYFGEICGKHSEIEHEFSKGEIKAIDIPSNVVDILEDKIGRTISGHNPLDYYEDQEE